MNPYLFVYGSLTVAHDHPQGQRLRTESLLIGPAHSPGRLYRVTWYPGLRPPQHASDIVHGEVYALADPARSLAWLDEYEGITPSASSAAGPDIYERTQRAVTIADGRVLAAWVYLYQRPLPEDSFIPDGRWRG